MTRPRAGLGGPPSPPHWHRALPRGQAVTNPSKTLKNTQHLVKILLLQWNLLTGMNFPFLKAWGTVAILSDHSAPATRSFLGPQSQHYLPDVFEGVATGHPFSRQTQPFTRPELLVRRPPLAAAATAVPTRHAPTPDKESGAVAGPLWPGPWLPRPVPRNSCGGPRKCSILLRRDCLCGPQALLPEPPGAPRSPPE